MCPKVRQIKNVEFKSFFLLEDMERNKKSTYVGYLRKLLYFTVKYSCMYRCTLWDNREIDVLSESIFRIFLVPYVDPPNIAYSHKERMS